jgi:hypothetical protein
MKTNIIIILFILSRTEIYSQSYIPLNLDTTCYWVHKYQYYNYDPVGASTVNCVGEKMSVVEKDTIISSQKYWLINTYLTELTYGWGSCTPYNYHGPSILIREDTAMKKIYAYQNSGDQMVLDYGKNMGDSLPSPPGFGGGYFPSSLIDSITYNSVNGIVRRFQWCKLNYCNFTYSTIEGIGASHNFPPSGAGEWGIPYFTLTCYSKGGVVLYSDGGSCTKKTALPLSINNFDLPNISYSYKNNMLTIKNNSASRIHFKLYNLDGRILEIHTLVQGISYYDLSSYLNGLYIFELSNNKEKHIDKLLKD